ncbi:MAG: hypothetical protein U0T83_03145 [Bacteriovoracaceae bacterium]
MRSGLTLLFLLLQVNLVFGTTTCLENRAAFDIGSGSVKILVASVNFCEHKIEKVFLNESKKIGFQSDLEKSIDNKFSSTIQTEAIKLFKELMSQAESYHPVKYSAVATAAFRKAANTNDFVKLVDKELSLKIKVIEQQEEAKLGHAALISQLTLNNSVPKKPIVVWDIGSGSMQITSKNEKNEFEFNYLGTLASVTFKNRVITDILKKDIHKVNSPNPIGKDNVKSAFRLIKKETSTAFQPSFLSFLKNAEIYGIGGVHASSILNQISKASNNSPLKKYTLDDLLKAIEIKALKNDQELGGEYAATDVTNLILVAGFMQTMSINTINVEKINLTNGLILE